MKDVLYRWGNVLIEVLVLATLGFAMVFFGGSRPWNTMIEFALLGTAFCLWAAMRLCSDEKQSEHREYGPFRYSSAPPLLIQGLLIPVLVLLILAFMLLQTTPLPTALLNFISPARVVQEKLLWATLGLPLPATLTIAINSEATRDATLLTMMGVMVLILGAYLANNRQRIRRVMAILGLMVILEAVYGLAEQLTGHGYVLWAAIGADNAKGTFINRNLFAATLSMFAPFSAGWLYCQMEHQYHIKPHVRYHWTIIREMMSSRQVLWVLAPVILSIGVIQSASRGGFGSLILGMGLFFALTTRKQRSRAISWISVLLGLLLLIYTLNSDYEIVLNRFEAMAEHGEEGRTIIWRDCLGIVRDFPSVGVGLGNFGDIFLKYSSTGFHDHAENEWLDGLIGLGMIGMSLVISLSGALLIQSLRHIQLLPHDRQWLIGLWCGLIGLAANSATEYHMHHPSIMMSAFFIAGVLMGINKAHPRIHYRHGK